jgi:2-oxo-4-hydroxy-4-carboxy-5-ureidoimidazoline decarboxylase
MSLDPITLAALNGADVESFERMLGDVFEHGSWVARAVAAERPFETVDALHRAMLATVSGAPLETRLAFIRGHPELAGAAAVDGNMGDSSASEQGSAGLDRLSRAELERFSALNRAYRERFGIPFIICVRHYTRPFILLEFERRLGRTPEEEVAMTLAQIGAITRLRIADVVDGPGRPKVDGRLSTHVLDTVSGRPAAGVRIELRDLSDGGAGVLMGTVETNGDGRTDKPLIADVPLRIGRYEIAFHIGAYFAGCTQAPAAPPFLDVVPVRFAIAEPEAHYHVPLLATPWSYSTYRGS